MKLPFAARARVDRRKVVDYLLSSFHPDGRSKARFFSGVRFSSEQMGDLRSRFEKTWEESRCTRFRGIAARDALKYRRFVGNSGWAKPQSPNRMGSCKTVEVAAVSNGFSDLGDLYDQRT